MNKISYANANGQKLPAENEAGLEVAAYPSGHGDFAASISENVEGESSTIPPPLAQPVLFDNIPAQLRALNQWVMWRFEWDADRNKFTRPLLQLNGRYARINDPATWSSFEQVRAAYECGTPGGNGRLDFDGIGVVLSEANELVGVDLDGQLGRFGQWSKLALETLESFDSYSERSPSGNGVRIFSRGTMAAKGHSNRKGIEIYRAARFLTVTGQHIPGTPRGIEDAQEAIDAFVERHFANADSPKGRDIEKVSAPSIEVPRIKLPAEQIAARARAAKNGHKFSALYDHGDLSDYDGDQSEADIALCGQLAFWSGRRSEVIDALFRKSALYREGKWNRPCSGGLSYGQYTIQKAIANCRQAFGEQLESVQSEVGEVAVTPDFQIDGIGGGERFAAQHRGRARYCNLWKCWMIYDRSEGRWIRDDCLLVEAFAKATARSIEREAQTIDDEVKRSQLRKFAQACTQRHKREQMLEDARSESGMNVLPTQLDSDLYSFNVLNGTIDLRTGRLRAHNREDLISHLSPVVFDPQAKCPVFEKFVGDIFNGDEALIDFMAQLMGYALSGETHEQYFFPVIGEGANGKSSFFQTLRRLMGSYAREFDPQTFMVRPNDRIAVDIADLHNVRMAVTSESSATHRLDEGKIKRMTGQEDLVGERKFEHPFTFTPRFKLFLVTNHLPQIQGTDHGIWRRVAPIPFTEHFWKEGDEKKGPENRRADLHLMAKLRAEFPGILNWALRGGLKLQQVGELILPPRVLAAKAAYRAEQDEMQGFLGECCLLDPRARCLSRELYGAYEQWCLQNDRDPISEGEFGSKLTERGIKAEKGKGAQRGKRTRVGVGLRDSLE